TLSLHNAAPRPWYPACRRPARLLRLRRREVEVQHAPDCAPPEAEASSSAFGRTESAGAQVPVATSALVAPDWKCRPSASGDAFLAARIPLLRRRLDRLRCRRRRDVPPPASAVAALDHRPVERRRQCG